MAMTQREKQLILVVLGLILVLTHMWALQKFVQSYRKNDSQLSMIEAKIKQFKTSGAIKEVIAAEREWLNQNQPQPIDFELQQSQLLEFLNTSASSQSITTQKPVLRDQKDLGGDYQRCAIQMEAKASEEQLYNWMATVHKPSAFRAVTSLKFMVDPKDKKSGLLKCIVGAEQWLIDIE